MRALTLAFVLSLFAAGSARADTLTVTGTGEDDGPCAAGACPSIRSALTQAAALPGTDTIEVPAGDYVLGSALTVSSDVTIHGASARTTIVHGGSSYRVFEVSLGVTATISHLTMRDGTADNGNGCWGGNLRSEGTLLLDHIRSTGGEACSGAGLGNVGAAMTVQSSLIDSNSADIGGSDSGGILNLGRADRPAVLTVRDTTIAFNYAGQIGGVFSWSYEGNIPNTTTLERVTLAYNSGGAVRRADATQTFTMRGSIVQGTCAGGIGSGGGNVESGSSCGFETQNDNALVSDALTSMGGETDVVIPGSSTAWIDAAGTCTGTDQRDVPRPQGIACDAGALELEPGVVISSGPSGTTNQRDASFTFGADAASGFQCRLDTPGDDGTFVDCTSPRRYESLGDGAYRFVVRALDFNANPVGAPAVRTFVVDTVAPTAPVITGASGMLTGTAEPSALIEIFDGGASAGTTRAAADGTWSYPIPAGAHTYTVRATDAAGNVSEASAPRVIAGVTQTPTPTPTATPTPVPQKDAVGKPSGTVLIKQGGKFVPFDPAKPIPSGAEIDVTHGRITLIAVLKPGAKPQTATFYDGIFKLTLGKTTTDLTLSQPLAKCTTKKAIAAAKKPKTRKLWGSGSGSFRTRGQYSAATVRGTEWLVQDSCSGTLTYVKKGVVSVFDQVKKKTIVLRAGKRYTAKPKRR